jgi:hypothetical protein
MHLDDGHYPRIKAYQEYDKDDVHKLIALSKWDEVSKVIATINPEAPNGSRPFLTYLAGAIHDRN